jgi:hypothetical protein
MSWPFEGNQGLSSRTTYIVYVMHEYAAVRYIVACSDDKPFYANMYTIHAVPLARRQPDPAKKPGQGK